MWFGEIGHEIIGCVKARFGHEMIERIKVRFRYDIIGCVHV